MRTKPSLLSIAPALLLAGQAQAHLMPAQQGTLNIVDTNAFEVLSVPVSALHGFDDDHDGFLSLNELQQHQASLQAEVERRDVVLDGDRVGHTVRVDLGLSPEHEEATDRAAHLLVLKHVRFETVPKDLRVRCDLFGSTSADQLLTITATRLGDRGKEAETAVLTPRETEHRFFSSRFSGPMASPTPGGKRALPLALGLVLAGVGVLLARPNSFFRSRFRRAG